MHGVIFDELESFVTEEYGPDAWDDLLETADTDHEAFLPTQAYPDSDLVEIVKTASESTDEPVQDLLYAFGEYTASDLLEMYEVQIADEWGYLDLISNTEEQIHKVVRRDMPEAEPPELQTKRVSEDEVRIRYASERQMCSVLEGIATGMASAYGTRADISQAQCMLEGASECHVSIRER